MSENKNEVLSKKHDEFMSRRCNFDDFIRLGANKVCHGMTLEFGALSLFFKVGGKLFLQHGNITLKIIDNPTRKQVDEIYHFFTDKHLDFMSTKVYNWESCFNGHGWYVSEDSTLEETCSNLDIDSDHKCVYPTQEDAASALAHCQLLHIVNKINKDYPRKPEMDYNYFICVRGDKITFDSMYTVYKTFGGLILDTKEGSEILIRDNEDLLKTYFKIK